MTTRPIQNQKQQLTNIYFEMTTRAIQNYKQQLTNIYQEMARDKNYTKMSSTYGDNIDIYFNRKEN